MHRPIHIMLVDTNEHRALVTRTLLSAGFVRSNKVQWIEGYDAGLGALVRGGHDICLVAYTLDEMGGHRFLEESVVLRNRTPIIALIPRAEPTIEALACRAGALQALPLATLDARQLANAIRAALGGDLMRMS